MVFFAGPRWVEVRPRRAPQWREDEEDGLFARAVLGLRVNGCRDAESAIGQLRKIRACLLEEPLHPVQPTNAYKSVAAVGDRAP